MTNERSGEPERGRIGGANSTPWAAVPAWGAQGSAHERHHVRE
jgi:hypothetical protein